MKLVKLNEAVEIIKRTNGRLFGAEFIKKDKSIRKIVCRLGVSKGVKGIVDRKAEDSLHNLMTVFDFNADRREEIKGGFRRINLNTLTKIRVNGEEYEIRNRV